MIKSNADDKVILVEYYDLQEYKVSKLHSLHLQGFLVNINWLEHAIV